MFNNFQQNPMNYYGNQMNNFQQNPMRQNQFITKQVTNIEEAKAFIINPFDTFLFIDVNLGKIYMKRMNNNGLSDFYTFEILQEKVEEKIDPLSEINQRLLNIENKLGGINNVKSLSNDDKSNNAKSNDSTDEKSKS